MALQARRPPPAFPATFPQPVHPRPEGKKTCGQGPAITAPSLGPAPGALYARPGERAGAEQTGRPVLSHPTQPRPPSPHQHQRPKAFSSDWGRRQSPGRSVGMMDGGVSVLTCITGALTWALPASRAQAAGPMQTSSARGGGGVVPARAGRAEPELRLRGERLGASPVPDGAPLSPTHAWGSLTEPAQSPGQHPPPLRFLASALKER